VRGRGALRSLSRVMPAMALALAACAGSHGTAAGTQQGSLSGTISVFAAASLADSFKALGRSFEEEHPGLTVQLNFAGTPTLVAQIEQGAQADVFASADTVNMDRLDADGLTLGAPAVFAHNRLEIVVARGNPRGITGLADLARGNVIYITEAPSVPAGRYALQALAKAGVSASPRSQETDVRSVVSKIELGEADAGIVYTTDVKAAGSRVMGVAIPDADNVVATYPIVTVRGSRNQAAANAFVAFAVSAAGQATLATFGFQHA
jgi:molybdate transport system substrate-binding protein